MKIPGKLPGEHKFLLLKKQKPVIFYFATKSSGATLDFYQNYTIVVKCNHL